MTVPGQDINLAVTITRNRRLLTGLNAFVSVLDVADATVLLAETALVEVATGLYSFLWVGTPSVPKKMMAFYRHGSNVQTEIIGPLKHERSLGGVLGVVSGGKTVGTVGGGRAVGIILPDKVEGEVKSESVFGEVLDESVKGEVS